MTSGITITFKDGRTLTLDEYKYNQFQKEAHKEYQEESRKLISSLPKTVRYRRPYPKDKVCSTKIIFSKGENVSMAEKTATKMVMEMLIKHRDKYLTSKEIAQLLGDTAKRATVSAILTRFGVFGREKEIISATKQRGTAYYKFKPDVKDESQIEQLAENYVREFNEWVRGKDNTTDDVVDLTQKAQPDIQHESQSTEYQHKILVEIRVLFGLLR